MNLFNEDVLSAKKWTRLYETHQDAIPRPKQVSFGPIVFLDQAWIKRDAPLVYQHCLNGFIPLLLPSQVIGTKGERWNPKVDISYFKHLLSI